VKRICVINPTAIGTDANNGGLEDELEAAAPEMPTIVTYETVAAEEEARSRDWVVPVDRTESGESYEVADDDNTLAEHIVNEIESQNRFIPESGEVSYSAQDLGEGVGHIADSGGENIDVAEIASDRPETNFHMKL
jgi:hypothetical protein